jgi:tetratricopeptide (TPR) repeat protein
VLTPQAQRVFRLSGVVSGPDLVPKSVAALAGIGDTAAASLLAELRAAHLVDETAPGRYNLHDLLRLYGGEQASNEEKSVALKRLYDFYLDGVDAATRLLYPGTLRLPSRGGTAIRFDDHPRALEWLDEERANLVASVLHAPAPVAWRLADALRAYLHLSMSYLDWERVANAGLAAAVAEGSIPGQAAAELSSGLLYVVQDRHPPAIDHCTRALSLARKAEWPEAEAYALNNLAAVHWAAGKMDEAEHHLMQSLEIDRRLGVVATLAGKLANLGIIHAVLGRLEQARAHLTDALSLDRESGSVSGEARTLANLAEVHQLLGDFDKAHEMLVRARSLHEKVGDRNGWATTTRALAALYRDVGSHTEALDAAHTALTVPRETGNQRLEGKARATLGSVWHLIGRHQRAIDLYRRALEVADSIGERYLKTEVLIGLAGTGDSAAAHEALKLAQRHGYRVLEGNALLAQADLHLGTGNRGLAAEAAKRALAIHGETGHRPGAARAEEVLAQFDPHPHGPRDIH